ncbi:MAG: HD domain-containing protein [Nitrososphaerales archaeon]|nr:HD domain-containing protein [Nitrososphaerales archaeon]
MILKPVTEIRDPVHGYVKITEAEREVIDSPFVQRLRRIHQLAGAYLVYPGAVHTRFDHVIGAMHVAGQIAEALSQWTDMTDEQIQEIRFAALLHDVGHGPFSHMYEEVLADKAAITHEDISQRIVAETSIHDILNKHGFSPRKMSSFAVGKQTAKPPFMNEIIAGGLSADIMDYLVRDSYFTGVEYGKVDIQRVIDSLRVAEKHLALDNAALYAFEALLLARYEMFKTVYFHRTVRSAELMLVNSMKLADSALHLTDLSDINDYLEMTDETVLHNLVSLDPSSPELEEAKRLAVDFRDRRLVKCVFEQLLQRKDRVMEQLFERGRMRDQVVLDIAEKAKVNKMHVYFDVPTTPSVPYTSSREALTSIKLVFGEGKKLRYRTVPLSELPLVGSIAGFMDILRIYTTAENRASVEKATATLFSDENYMTKISV